MNKDGFLRDLLNDYIEGDYNDVDGGTLHELLLKHGFTVERPITAAEAEEDWAREYCLHAGDVNSMRTPEMIALLEKTK